MKKNILILSLLAILIGSQILSYYSIQRTGNTYSLMEYSDRCKFTLTTMNYKGEEYIWGFGYSGDVPNIGVVTSTGTVMIMDEIRKYQGLNMIKPNTEFLFDIDFVKIRYKDQWCAIGYSEAPHSKKPSYVLGKAITYNGCRVDFGVIITYELCSQLKLGSSPKKWRTGPD